MKRPFLSDVIRILERVYYAKSNLITDKLKRGISKTRFDILMLYLKDKHFIVIINNKHITLTDIGVDFLINYKRQLNQGHFNEVVALTGCILAITSIYLFLKNIFTNIPVLITIIFITLAVISLGPIVAFILNALFRRRI